MRGLGLCVCLSFMLTGIVFGQQTTEAAGSSASRGLTTSWKNGIKFQSEDGQVKVDLRGRLHTDWTWAKGENDLEDTLGAEVESGTEVRRGYIGLKMTLYGDFLFLADYDLAGGDADLKDAYIGMQNLPHIGTLLVGHFEEPLGLDTIGSSNDFVFIESASMYTLVPGYNSGIRANNAFLDDRATWSLGIHGNTDGYGMGVTDGGCNVTGRISGLPWKPDEERYLHLALALSQRGPADDSVRYRSRPENNFVPYFADTGTFAADAVTVYGIEAASGIGPLLVQAEYSAADHDSEAADDPLLSGWYIQTSYVLTGEKHDYKSSIGSIGGVTPKNDFKPGKGIGAWEVAARYSELDLEDEGTAGGLLKDITLGINWYLYSNVRLMMNYISSDLDDAGRADILATRFQVTF